MKENTSYKVKSTTNSRLAEMGFIRGTIVRIVKKVHGMIQLRFNGSDVVIREELFKEIECDMILEDMKMGGYEHLVTTFDDYFGDYIDLER